jgi:hypothetical protein
MLASAAMRILRSYVIGICMSENGEARPFEFV